MHDLVGPQVREQLEAAAAQVQPIMKKRGWRVSKLSEFLPTNKGLLVRCKTRTWPEPTGHFNGSL